MNKVFTTKEVLEVVDHVLHELYGTSLAGNSAAQDRILPTEQPKSIGQIDPYMLRNYSLELAPQLKTMAGSLGPNRMPVINMIAGIFERLSPQWATIAKQKFMQLTGITGYPV